MKKLLLGLALVSGIGSVYAQNNLEGVMVDTKTVKRIRIMDDSVKKITLSLVGIEWGCGKPSIARTAPVIVDRTTKVNYMSVISPCIFDGVATQQVVSFTEEILVKEGQYSVEVTFDDNLELTIQTSK